MTSVTFARWGYIQDMHTGIRPTQHQANRGLRVRASASMKERKTNLTSCWIERSKMELASRDCAIYMAY